MHLLEGVHLLESVHLLEGMRVFEGVHLLEEIWYANMLLDCNHRTIPTGILQDSGIILLSLPLCR